jgi:hypothetical protein
MPLYKRVRQILINPIASQSPESGPFLATYFGDVYTLSDEIGKNDCFLGAFAPLSFFFGAVK